MPSKELSTSPQLLCIAQAVTTPEGRLPEAPGQQPGLVPVVSNMHMGVLACVSAGVLSGWQSNCIAGPTKPGEGYTDLHGRLISPAVKHCRGVERRCHISDRVQIWTSPAPHQWWIARPPCRPAFHELQRRAWECTERHQAHLKTMPAPGPKRCCRSASRAARAWCVHNRQAAPGRQEVPAVPKETGLQVASYY